MRSAAGAVFKPLFAEMGGGTGVGVGFKKRPAGFDTMSRSIWPAAEAWQLV
jgi:hypothetical protein